MQIASLQESDVPKLTGPTCKLVNYSNDGLISRSPTDLHLLEPKQHKLLFTGMSDKL